jgi:hypothetical protein
MTTKISELAAAASLVGTELVELSKLSTTVVYTATTLSAAASDNSYNDSAAQFVAEGFAVGDSVKVTGFTGNAANNIFTGRITALTTSKMTIGGADGNVIVDDAAGESVTITKWESKRTTISDIIAASSTYLFQVAASDESSALTAGTNKIKFHWPVTGTVTQVWAGLSTAQTSGSTLTVDVNNAGSTMLSTKVTIDNTEETSLSAATPAVLNGSASITKGALGAVDIDTVGNGTAKGLKLYFEIAL